MCVENTLYNAMSFDNIKDVSKGIPLNKCCKSLSEKIRQKNTNHKKLLYHNKEQIEIDNVISNIACEQEKARV